MNVPVLILALLGICIAAEMLYSRFAGKNLYQPGETFVNIACGILERLLDLLVFMALFTAFTWLHDSGFTLLHLLKVEHIPFWAIILPLLLITDFCWYWYHRISHEVNILWAIHIVHHQSEDYNLSVAFRVTGLQSLVRFFFWVPLPLLGFMPYQSVLGIGILGIYQFFMHTQLVKRIKWLEPWIVTPSHHRVHHASNDACLDKNYAGLFSFYDRMFGSFAVENEVLRYGTTRTFRRTNLLGVYFDYFKDIYKALALKTSGRRPREILLGNPAQMPKESQNTHVAVIHLSLLAVILMITTILVNMILLFILLSGFFTDHWQKGIAIAFIVFSIVLMGLCLEKKQLEQ